MLDIVLPTRRDDVQRKYEAPQEAVALNDHAHELAQHNKVAASVVALRRAVALAPEHPILLSCLGAVLYDAGEYLEAEGLLRKSIGIEPDYAPAHGNLGSALGGLGRHKEAWSSFRRAIEIEPDYADARWNYAMSLLDGGNWSEAWKHYEARFDRGAGLALPRLPYPLWKGEDLNGKTLYVQGEQGVGDRILCSRYLSWIKQEFPQARILFCANSVDFPDISNLMYAYRGVVDEFTPPGITWPVADYGIYLMSLPGLHGSTPDNVPDDPGLFRAQALRQKRSINLPEPHHSALKIGIAWTGNTAMKRNAERSIPLEMLLSLAELPNVVLYSLQFGSPDIHNLGAGQLICDLSGDIKPFGFSGTAAVMGHLDLVITCCTSVAHLAGAVGVPCITMLCANAYWVWLRDREDSVWYQNIKLIRQSRMNDWSDVMDRVRDGLSNLSAERVLQAAE